MAVSTAGAWECMATEPRWPCVSDVFLAARYIYSAATFRESRSPFWSGYWHDTCHDNEKPAFLHANASPLRSVVQFLCPCVPSSPKPAFPSLPGVFQSPGLLSGFDSGPFRIQVFCLRNQADNGGYSQCSTRCVSEALYESYKG
ncbi:hypothetical protein J6590_066303 [Homalodisca vitripennis]|nr:hypothetical protein J6590_066303 [Homalodisca vitripennis]